MGRRGKPSSASTVGQPRPLSGWRLLATFALTAFALLSMTGCAPNAETGSETEATRAHSAETADDEAVAKAVPSAGLPAVKSDGQQAAANAATSPENQPSACAQNLVVRFIDVGQGDCALVTCGDASMLIDGGPPGSSSKVYSILRDLGVARLDAIVVTHPDADHCGGVAAALRYASCGAFYCSTNASDTETFAGLARQLESEGTAITVPSRGDSFALGEALCTFVGPARAMQSDNDNSLVLRLEYGGTSFLFAADAEVEAEQALIASGDLQPADVLKVAHHGSSSSSSPSFLKAIQPRYAVVSVGENSYGHPSPVVLDRLAALSCEVLRTDEVGTIIARSDGESLSVETTKGEVHE